MEAELKSLESKIEQLIDVCQMLRGENQQLRQQLASTLDHKRRLEEKIATATTRLEALLGQIPAEDEA